MLTTKLQRLAEMEARYDGTMPQSARDYIANGDTRSAQPSSTFREYLACAVKAARVRHAEALRRKPGWKKDLARRSAWACLETAKSHRAEMRRREAIEAAEASRAQEAA